MKKKILCLFIILIMSIPVTNVAASDDTLTAQVGIPADLSAHKIIKLDEKKDTSQPTLLENTQVVNNGDSLSVFSSPHDREYNVSAASLRSVLLGSTVLGAPGELTSNGYDLNYYSPGSDVAAEADTNVEHGGFVRATKADEEPIDIPIISSEELTVIDGPSIGINWNNVADGTNRQRDAGGLSGKHADDKALQFTVSPGVTISGGNPTRSDTQGINTLNTPKSVITIEFAVRATGDLVANLDMDNGTNLMRFSADGTFSYYSYNAGQKYIDVNVCNDASQWHNVAIVCDYAGNRFRYYFDGKLLTQSGNLTSTTITQLRFGPRSSSYVNGGTVAFDNLRISRGYYSPYDSVALSSDSDAIIINENTILYDPSRINTFSDLMDNMTTDADSVSLFSDNTYTAFAQDLSTGNMLVLYDEENDAYSYFKLHSWKLDISSVSFERNGTMICAKAQMNYRGADGVKATLVLVLLDEEGRVSAVTSSPEALIIGDCELVTQELELGECSAKAFFITDLTSRLGINNIIYSKEE